ncbi:uncharacterized protein K489DRAFT_63035 [Dissoconium aciculare CBS 342.82]|uniref:NADH-ubiquinone oxidoreductase B15 subunit n=1 Tax=Dissoconium aciculare CBS 342.82 TaxID=1314786 RepID=A0A6J3LW22_9PEZI|nr:uncharacterized protein K489DRAFT_63035 [Dissoconium aciculare CBS 342.82]KAF1819971.1 hypothetical protein K489DRAFT_63035 [Dissoconium aciculare CBS 342.82]
MDPALVKYANMYTKRHEFFRWTPRTAWLSFVYIIAIPSATLYLFQSHEGKYSLRGKLKGDVIAEF